ncbi:hypothetical protein OGAPHI_004578 [Ogataea philodendri]|uniref:Uncharacterized protein n=1 Tax=Ogataea philodendri TaxID=1378263 RepID=A0A9P8P3L5_9ASCO|nr:uncharacterized protein OGAPHI_004578 [Ogataea philodendri]KAH3664227.1 hypothetical protein OGAPHI_004578 [Ogataea philodendri]
MSFRPYNRPVTALAVSKTGALCLSSCLDRSTISVNLASTDKFGEPVTELANDTIKPISWIRFHPSLTQQILTCSGDIKLWDLETRKPMIRMHGSVVTKAIFLENGLVAGCGGTSIDFYDSRVSGHSIHSLQGYHTDDITSLSAVNGLQLVSGGNDGMVNLYDLRGTRNVGLDMEIVYDMVDQLSVTQVEWRFGRCFAKLHGACRIVEIDFVRKNNEICKEYTLLVDKEEVGVDFDFSGDDSLVVGGDNLTDLTTQTVLLQPSNNDVVTRLALTNNSGVCATNNGYIYKVS